MIREQLVQVAQGFREEGFFPSCAVSVFDAQHTLCRFSIGEAQEDSLFDLASLTKLATATLVLDSIEEGRFQLQDTLPQLLPWVRADEQFERQLQGISLYQLLTHTSGLPAWYPFYAHPDFESALKAALQTPRAQGMEYSDIGFILLGKVLEEAWQAPLDAVLRQRLVQPLGLDNFGFLPDLNQHILPSGYGNPHEMEIDKTFGLQFHGFRPLDLPIIGQAHDGNSWYAFCGVSGHAGIFSNLDGVQKLGQHYLSTDSALKQAAMREQFSGRGLGFEAGDMYPQGCGHTGFTGTSLYLSRSLGIGCVILSNRCFYPDGNYKLTNPFRREMNHLAAAHFGKQQKDSNQ
ncbi:MAG: serine hydrolase [Bacillota bacterium]|nr:serine hydrolase [Bacillota bacterium]